MFWLTDEEIRSIKKKADRIANDLINSTEGNFKPEEIDGIYQDADKEICKTQLQKFMLWQLALCDTHHSGVVRMDCSKCQNIVRKELGL